MSKKLIDISTLSSLLNLIDEKTGKPTNYVLRFWEKEFKQIKPIILKGNRRYYDKKLVEKIKFIKYLLKDKGLTISGAKKILDKKKSVDVDDQYNVESEYFKNKIKAKSKVILEKIKKIKNYG